MMTFSSRAIAVTVASLMLAGSAFAQTTTTPAPAAPAATAPAAKAAPGKAKSERTAASLACSTQADAKGLHGKERKKFRSDCKKNAGKAN